MGFSSTRILIALVLLLSSFCLELGYATDIITPTKSIHDPEAIVSNGSIFKLGFFNPPNSTNRYVGIWYSKSSATNVVWVANRNKPLKDSSGSITISEDGNLVVLNGQKEILWSSNVSNPVTNSSAQLLDSGNLVLQDNNGNNLWESFQQPSDAFLERMKLSTNVGTGKKVQLTSWKSPSDPSIGSFSAGVDPRKNPEILVWNNSNTYVRSGPWNGQIFIGIPDMSSLYNDGFVLVDDKEGSYYLTYAFTDESFLSYYFLDSQGNIVQKYWDDRINSWQDDLCLPLSECDIYGKCGAFGICNSQILPICSCLRGFEPKNAEEWDKGNWSSGCVRSKTLPCNRTNNVGEVAKEDGFLKLEDTKVPDFAVWSPALEDECKNQCLNNCSCIAYAYYSGVGCMSWSGDLIDIQRIDKQRYNSGGADLYIRLSYSEFDKKSDAKVIIIIAIAVIIGTIAVALCTFYSWSWMTKHRALKAKREEMALFNRDEANSKLSGENMLGDNLNQVKFSDLLVFNFEKLATATNNFDLTNKLGQGGFGPVYKGKMHDGLEIAVKRLSKASGQGLEEFMNEMVVISKLQHRNLVRLLGCCVEGEEKMLVYEYMPNKSLDAFLFDPVRQYILDWRKRFNIIEGIGRGLLYLHRDSRLKIIHRDLKASNILLDEGLNPKISDFGMAKIFGGTEDQANTRRVVGTYGYMSPEYAMEGLFSEKSDVFSFGVLLLEIVSGRRNSSFIHDESLSLLGYVWKLWNEDNIVALIDPAISDPSLQMDILRCIHVGLLCVQEFAKDRPYVSVVISMLNSEIVDLPTPKQPAFIERLFAYDTEPSDQSQRRFSINNVTVTIVEGR